MPEKSGFFDTTADDPRQYPAREFAEYFSRFIGNGIFGGGTNLKVTATGTDNKVSIQTGWAWINGYIYSIFNEPLTLTIPLATDMDRIDRIILRLNVSTPVRSIKAMVLQGTPGVSPTPPAIVRSGDIYDISLAQVRMVANEATVQPGNITDERLNTAVCGIVTGVVEQADTTTIFNEFDQYRQQKQVEFAQAWSNWFAAATANFEGDWDTWFNQTKQDWQDWFDDAQDLLIPDGSVTDVKLSNAPGDLKARFSDHTSDTDNPHAVTKAQVGLGSVQNYGVASQAQAEAGTANNVYMTPLRTKQAITAQTGGVPLRINNGKLEYNDGTGWKSVGSPIMVGSNTLKHSFLTERKVEGTDDGADMLVAKFIPPGTGEFRLEFDVRRESGELNVLLGISRDTGHSVIEDYWPDNRLPVGSIPPSYSMSGGMSIVSTTNLYSTYTTISRVITVRTRQPIYLILRGRRPDLYPRYEVYIRNVRIYYDEI